MRSTELSLEDRGCVPELDLLSEEREGVAVYSLPTFLSFGVDAFFTTRAGGVSLAPYDELNLGNHVGDNPAAVQENRARVARAAGVDPDHLIIPRQVHGSDVAEITGPSGELTADALRTRLDDTALAILVADCVPLLIADAFSDQFAVVHAGWRGLAAGVIAATVQQFPDPTTLYVAVGPHIAPSRYQVGSDVAAHFAHVDGALRDDESPDEHPRFLLNLSKVALQQLTALRVPASQVYFSPVFSSDDPFFSDRQARPCGRFALVARRANYDDAVVNAL